MDYCQSGDLSKRIMEAKKRRVHFSEEMVLNWFV